ncbi:unnamed protein product [Sphagnum balticum]
MEGDDTENIEYYYNAVKAQYLIEDTIANIELINENSQNELIVMICDNNALDVKLMNESPNIWEQFLPLYRMSHEFKADEDTEDFFREIGMDRKLWSKLESPQLKYEYILKSIERSIEENAKRINCQP